MGKTNWSRVFLGGLLAGIVLNVLSFATLALYMRKLWGSALEAFGHPIQLTVGFQIFLTVYYLVLGILAVWLYSAIRARYGAGPKTAVCAALAVWIFGELPFSVTAVSFGLFPTNLIVIDGLTYLVKLVVATLAGAWVYKEQSQ